MTGAQRRRAEEEGPFHLRLIATSDLHGHLMPWDYHADRPDAGVGLARTAPLIARLREGVASLLLDNGDALLGNPMADRIADLAPESAEARAPHPVVQAMNALGYDAATLGNHEFDHGLAFLRRALAQAAFPVVSANAQPGDGAPLCPPHAILSRALAGPRGERARVAVGVVGFLPPQTVLWNRAVLDGALATPDIVETAARAVPRLRAAGADLVVALAHTGIAEAAARPGMENAATALASVPGIDAIVAGHQHLVFPSPAFAGLGGVDAGGGRLGGVPAVMPGAFGSHVGVIDLWLRRGPGGWRVAEARAAAHPVAAPEAAPEEPSAAVLRPAAAAHAATLAQMRETVGATPRRLTTHFALVADAPAVRAVAAALRDHAAARLAGTRWAGLPLVAAAAPFRVGGRGGPGRFTDIPAGPVARRHVADLYPYPNRIAAVVVTGAVVAEWLERAASIFLPLRPGQADQPLIDPAIAGYTFDTLLGVTYVIDPSVPARYDRRGDLADPAARRIRDLRLDGRPLRPDERVVAVANSYRLATWAPLAAAPQVPPAGSARADRVLLDWVAAGGLAQPDRGPGWRLALPEGASALLRTAVAADPQDLAGSGLRAEPLGRDAEGFMVMRLSATPG
jgi:2',3'-cyclic-nucleotide 2'-phosphodiesterase/3'-nucleotidase